MKRERNTTKKINMIQKKQRMISLTITLIQTFTRKTIEITISSNEKSTKKHSALNHVVDEEEVEEATEDIEVPEEIIKDIEVGIEEEVVTIKMNPSHEEEVTMMNLFPEEEVTVTNQ